MFWYYENHKVLSQMQFSHTSFLVSVFSLCNEYHSQDGEKKNSPTVAFILASCKLHNMMCKKGSCIYKVN